MSKPIDIRNVPNNYEELLEYVPKGQYTKNAITQNRRITKLNSEQAFAGMNFQANLEAVFRIAPSNTTLLNLAECYFSITGWLAREIANGEEFRIPQLKCGPLWVLRALNKIVIEIGGVAVHTIMGPAQIAKLIESMTTNYNDKEQGILENNGFCAGVDSDNFFNTCGDWANINGRLDGIELAAGKYRTYKQEITNNGTNKAGVTYKHPKKINNSIVFCGTSTTSPPSIVPKPNEINLGTDKYWIWKFKQNLYLKDIFPGLETMKPLFSQGVVVRLQWDSDGFTNIIDSFGGHPKIFNFEQFYLNVYQYHINTEMIAKLNQIYSKPVVEIIDAYDKQVQSIPSIESNNELQIFIPLALNFECDFLCLYIPNSIANNACNNLILGKCANKKPNANLTSVGDDEGNGGIMNVPILKNFTEHCPSDHRFVNINRVSIEADGEILYQRTFNENPYPANAAFSMNDSPYQVLVNSMNLVAGANHNYPANTTVEFNDYTNAYELYKQCRAYYDLTEDSALPFNEWLYSGFMLCVPASCFTRLTTGSQVCITINFGAGVVNTSSFQTGKDITLNNANGDGENNKIGLNERIVSATNSGTANQGQIRTEVLKQIIVFQKYKKALVYNGFNNCSIKTISQSFEQDIQIDEPENKTNAN